jgi:PAS domain S-box-containing protein
VLVTFSDLTELQKTKLELESILNFVPVGIFKTDLVGNCNYVNPAWSNLTGLTEMEARGTGWSKALHFEDNDRVSQEWNKAIHSKVPFESSFRYLRPNQSVSNVYCRTRTLFDKMDKPIGYLGSVQDMTSLRISEQFNLFYRVALDQAAIVAFTDPKGKITYVNEMFCKISDYSREELIGKDHRILNSGKMGKAFFSDLWKTIATGKHWNGEICNRAKNGTYYWVSTTIVPFVNENGQIEKYIAIRRDITNEKNQQLALSEIHSALENTKDRLEIALQGSGIGVWEWDIVTKKLSWDDEMFRIYGVTPDEFSNLYDAWVNGIHPEDSKRAQHEVQLAVLDKKYFDTEFRVVDKTGHVTHVLGRGKVIRDDEGKPKKMIGINWDITKTKDNEKALEKAKKLADEANRAKSEFLASMSHEIRTPMNSIIGMADLLSESKLDSVQARQIGILKGAGDSLLTLINNILDLSKIEAGEFIVDSTEFNLETMVEKACDTLAIKAHSKQIEFALKILPEVNQYYFGDPLRLQQVLINLIGNAVKFTPKNGEISVIVDIDPSNSGHVRFRVKDSGIGLSENQMKSIFKSFVQGDANISVQYGGTGLGLAISKHLVNLMKGTIDVISKHEEGAIFYFSIPLRVSTRKEMQNPEPMSSSPIIEGRELLVVDDNTTNREIVIGYLEKWKAKATQAESGRRALEILKSHRKFDLVILDKRMPDLDGLELIRSIDNELLNRESVLMLTSDCKAEDIIEAKRLGLGAYLIKPIKRSELKLAIEDVLLRRERHFANADGTLKMIEPEKQTAKRIGADQNILVVDDNLDNIYLIQTYLKSLPFHLEIAENGESAVEKFMQGAFSAVLMDLRMKGKDGYTTTREIREWEKRNGKSRTPIIALTAYALRNEVESALQAGCDVYLTKPVLKQTLIDTLSDVMKKSPS